MGEQEEAVVLDFKKPRVVKCVCERVLVMRDEGELVSYKTSTWTLLWRHLVRFNTFNIVVPNTLEFI